MPRTGLQQADIGLYTFGQKTPNTPVGQYMIDVAGLRDPLSNRGFKNTYPDGTYGPVIEFVREDPRAEAILDMVRMIAFSTIRSQGSTGRYLSFSFRDHHGKWTAAAMGEIAANFLGDQGYKVSLYHYEVPQSATELAEAAVVK